MKNIEYINTTKLNKIMFVDSKPYYKDLGMIISKRKEPLIRRVFGWWLSAPAIIFLMVHWYG